MRLNFLFFEDSIFDRLSKWNVLTGLTIAVLGFLLMIFSSKLTNTIFKKKSDEEKRSYIARFKIASLIIVLAGCFLVLVVDYML